MSSGPADTTVRPTADADDQPVSARTIDRLAHFHGGELSVVSMYIGLPPGSDARGTARTKVDSLLHGIRRLGADRSPSHAARQSVRTDIERIEAQTRNGALRPGTLAIFSCGGAGLLETVQLPRPVRDRLMVDATPWIRPMLAVLDEYRRCCTLVLDSDSAHVWELYLGVTRDAGSLHGRTPAPRSRRGLSARSDSNRADGLTRRHFRAVAKALEQLCAGERYDVLIIGGHEHELPGFLDFLPRQLRQQVIGTFSIDPRTAAAAAVRDHAQEILDRHELDEQRRGVEKVLEAASAGGLGAVGLERSLWAGSVAAIQTLYVRDGAVAPGVVCDESGWLATSGETCPLCGGAVRETPDVIEALAEAVIDQGGGVHHVRAASVLQRELAASSLRFALPAMPEVTGGAGA